MPKELRPLARQSLRLLRALTTEPGEDALVEAAIDRGVDTVTWPEGETRP